MNAVKPMIESINGSEELERHLKRKRSAWLMIESINGSEERTRHRRRERSVKPISENITAN